MVNELGSKPNITKTCPCNIQRFFSGEKKNEHFIDLLNVFAQNIHRGYTLEPPQRGGSNEYPQCMFWIKNRKKIGMPLYTPVFIHKSGV